MTFKGFRELEAILFGATPRASGAVEFVKWILVQVTSCSDSPLYFPSRTFSFTLNVHVTGINNVPLCGELG